MVERGGQKLIEKEVDLLDCIPYPCGYNGKKAHWRRTESEMYKKVKLSLRRYGMVNPLWVFETAGGMYQIVKGSCRAVAAWDLLQEGDKRFTGVRVLVAPLGMSRQIANKLFRSSEYKDVSLLDLNTGEVLKNPSTGEVEIFPKGF